MVFGKKKKKKVEDENVEAGIIDTSENPEADEDPIEPPQKPLTKAQKENIKEMQAFLDYFTNRYAYVSFEDNFGGIKPMLFAIFCELKKINVKLEEDEE